VLISNYNNRTFTKIINLNNATFIQILLKVHVLELASTLVHMLQKMRELQNNTNFSTKIMTTI
jgi:hypothetical protein